mgnify:CR=1 FL=1
MILVGDYAPGPCSVDVNISGNLILANLEGPLLPQNHSFPAVPKAGPNLYSRKLPNDSADYIFSLANNHTMDFGQVGMDTTIHTLHKQGVRYCGAGLTVQSARNPLVILDGEVSVGIIACCEAQFGVARPGQAGVAEFGPWIYREIRSLSEHVDSVIISVHAGVEDAPWPSPYIRDLYRSFIDAGATIVHGHHAHVPQGYEQYSEGVIFYGLGNFAVNPSRWQNRPNGLWSVGVEIDLNSKPLKWQPISLEIRHQVGSEKICVEKSSPGERKGRMQYLEICNQPLHDDSLFEALWQEVAVRAYYAYGGHYMGTLLGSGECHAKESLSILKKAVFRQFHSAKIDTRRLLLYYNMLACESHRQMLTTALGVLSGEITDLRNNEIRRFADEMVPWPCEVIRQ